MKDSTKTNERALSLLAVACYVATVALCGLAAYAFARLTAAAQTDAVHRFHQPFGIF